MGKKNKSFVDCIEIINTQIIRRRGRWRLNALAWIDFDDISSILRIHIFKKWHLYDQKQPLAPWVNKIITNQLQNLTRNLYSNFTKPCLGPPQCAGNEGGDLCSLTESGKQCGECIMYRRWEIKKKSAYDTKLPISLDGHNLSSICSSNNFNPQNIINFHEHMLNVLTGSDRIAYKALYVDEKSEKEASMLLGYGKSLGGVRQVKKLAQKLTERAKKEIANGEVDILE